MARVMLIPMTLYRHSDGPAWGPDYRDEIAYDYSSRGNARDFALCEVWGTPAALADLASRSGVIDLGDTDNGAPLGAATQAAIRAKLQVAGVALHAGRIGDTAAAFSNIQAAVFQKQRTPRTRAEREAERDAIVARRRSEGRWLTGG